MFKWFKSILGRDLDALTNDELSDLGAEFTEEGDRALTVLQNRQKELIEIYKRAHSEFACENYSLTMEYLNRYVSLAGKYGVMIIPAVFDLRIGIVKETMDPEAVLLAYDEAIAYYKQLHSEENVLRFEQSKEYYKASLN